MREIIGEEYGKRISSQKNTYIVLIGAIISCPRSDPHDVVEAEPSV